jgi:DNA primase
VYVRELTGQRIGRDRKVRCPLHDDRTPSLHVYERPEQGWYCFGCGRGGSIYDLAGPLYGLPIRGAGFVRLRRLLCDRFGT